MSDLSDLSDLSDIGKSLLQSLNKNNNGYHPLEDYIYAIDYNLDSSNTLRSIGERIGIYVSDVENVQEGLYIKLEEYLQREKDYRITEKIMNMSPNEYETYIISLDPSNANLDRASFYPLYADRLYLSLSQ